MPLELESYLWNDTNSLTVTGERAGSFTALINRQLAPERPLPTLAVRLLHASCI